MNKDYPRFIFLLIPFLWCRKITTQLAYYTFVRITLNLRIFWNKGPCSGVSNNKTYKLIFFSHKHLALCPFILKSQTVLWQLFYLMEKYPALWAYSILCEKQILTLVWFSKKMLSFLTPTPCIVITWLQG